MRPRRSLFLLHALSGALALTLGAVLAPGAALAQPAMTRALSRTAFEEGMKLYKAGAYPAACAKLEESLQLEAQMGTRFWLADCYEHAGRAATAWGHFLAVAADAQAAGNATREATARARAAALGPNLPRLVVVVPDPVRATPGLTVQRDESVVGAVLWGTPIPVDSGEHKVRASAPGKETWETVVTVGSAGSRVEVPPLRDVSTSTLPAPAPPSAAPPVVAPPPALPPIRVSLPEAAAPVGEPAWRRPVLVTTGTLGAVLVVAGGALGILTVSTWNSAVALCPSHVGCSPAALADQSRATTFATLSDVGLVVGGAALAGTLIGGLVSRPAVVRVAPTVGGLVAGGSLP